MTNASHSIAPVKVGMLGAGFILKSHATAVKFTPNTVLHVVGDASLGRAQAAAAEYGFAHAVGSIDEMAASDCDVVHILLPPALHLPAALTLIGAGKSVFIEKPMSLSGDECQQIVDAAAAKGVTVGVNHNFLFGRNYQPLRDAVLAGEIGRVDHISVNWLYYLGLITFGPFDNWILSAPANVLFELGAHLVAFVHDLVGAPIIHHARASDAVTLPSGISVPRRWAVDGEANGAAAVLNLSLKAGQEDRYIRVRGRGGSLQYDFGRDFGWRDTTVTDNPMLDAHAVPATLAKSVGSAASSDRVARIKGSLKKHPQAQPFDESIFRSINAFYAGGVAQVDRRHSGEFAVAVIRTCEAITAQAGVGLPSRSNAKPLSLPTPAARPTVLVIGGTGFIGKRLVRKLVDAGKSVRVMTRSATSAGFEMAGMPVEIFTGSHGDRDAITRALDGIDTVYHLAKAEGKKWDDYVRGDVEPTRVLGQAAKAAGVKRFIYTGTIDSYASDNPNSVITNTTPVDPAITKRNLYARSKATCEALLRDMGLPLVIMRPGIVIGRGSPPAHLGIGKFTSETRVIFWGDGTNMLPLVHVDDVADALVLAGDAPASVVEGKQFLLTSPPLLNGMDYVAALEAANGSSVDTMPGSPTRFWMADMVKEVAKNAIRHPNRRWPTRHDQASRAHVARYDASETEAALGWKPIHNRAEMIARGIKDAVID